MLNLLISLPRYYVKPFNESQTRLDLTNAHDNAGKLERYMNLRITFEKLQKLGSAHICLDCFKFPLASCGVLFGFSSVGD